MVNLKNEPKILPQSPLFGVEQFFQTLNQYSELVQVKTNNGKSKELNVRVSATAPVQYILPEEYQDNKIIATGYNGAPRGRQNCTDLGYCIREKLNIPSGTRREVCRAICAEQLAISEAARNGVKLDGGIAYITTFPCHICAKLLVSSGISEIVYDKDYPDELSKEFLLEAGVNIRQI